MCIEKELSDKSKYPTFARTAVTGFELTSTVHELLKYYKWKKVSVIWHDTFPYKKLYEEFHASYDGDIVSAFPMEIPGYYNYREHHNVTRGYLQKIYHKSKSEFLLFAFSKVIVNMSPYRDYISKFVLSHWVLSISPEKITKPQIF